MIILNGIEINNPQELELALAEINDEASKVLIRNSFYGTNDPVPVSLDVKKKESIDRIDEIVKQSIVSGFVFQDKIFSMSVEAQINWSNLMMIPEGYFPLKVNTKDDTVYELSIEDRSSFYMAALGHKTYHLNVGTQRKQMVLACESNEEIDSLMESFVWSNSNS